MDTQTFLRTIWPDEGFYALATPFSPPGSNKRVYAHKVFASIDAAAAEAERLSGIADVFFCVHSLRKRKVWNPLKKNYKTGELGAYDVRVHSNMLSARAFFFDVDIDAGNPRKYPDVATALTAIRDFCQRTGMPLPMVVSSGTGLHLYWVLDSALPSPVWRQIAERLRALSNRLGLLVDPARTVDQSSVLRVAGTMHLKDRNNPRPVRVLRTAKPVAAGQFVAGLRDACIRCGVKTKLQVRRPRTDAADHADPMADIGGNVEAIHGPPPTMRALLTACAQMKHIYENQHEVSEPEWFYGLNIVRFVEDADEWAHRISAQHPGYSRSETTDKFERIKATGVGPTSCDVLAQTCGEERCAGCRFSARVLNPIMAARMMDAAPAPSAPAFVVRDDDDDDDDDEALITLPDAPAPFRRLRGGGIVMDMTSKDGDSITVPIYEHDLYPLRRVVNLTENQERLYWRAVLPREGIRDFTVDADALYDNRKLASALANSGVYVSPNNLSHMRDYMIAYITELQKTVDAETQTGHLGWNEDKTQFTFPDKALHRDGTSTPVMLTTQAERAAAHVTKAGTLEAQVETLRFFDHPNYIANQFYIMCGLAAPLYHMTGHYGVIVNGQGIPGTSKSTANYTAASFWGHPKLYPINGTNSGATVKGRNERVSTLANLPICVDEITHMASKDAIDLAMNITQPGHRIRLDMTGTERAAHGGVKSTIMLTTSNHSVHELLSSENVGGTAGSMRVFEITFRLQGVHQKWEADDYLLRLDRNYGHIGEAFIEYVLKNYNLVHERVRSIMRIVDERANIKPAERFWSAVIAVTTVTASIAKKLGLTSWDPAAMLTWALDQQIPAMRGRVSEEYTDPVDCLLNYLTEIHGATIVVNRDAPDPLGPKHPGEPGNAYRVEVIAEPRGYALLAQYDVGGKSIWMAHRPFREYCRRVSASWRDIIDALKREEVIIGRGRRVIGANTRHAKAPVDAHLIDASHPVIASTLLPKWAEMNQPSGSGNVVSLPRKKTS